MSILVHGSSEPAAHTQEIRRQGVLWLAVALAAVTWSLSFWQPTWATWLGLAWPLAWASATWINRLSMRSASRTHSSSKAEPPGADVLKGLPNWVDASGQVLSRSQELCANTEGLRNRVEESAGLVESTAGALSRISAAVREMADGARQAAQLSRDNSGAAQQGSRIMDNVVQQMQGIGDSSARITDIIGVIDGIAFQTNILALNAAVEAARAGDAGRGFAVVASEVRQLAQRSATAAREIKQLISSSGQQVRAGREVVDQARHAMQGIVHASDSIAGHIERISQHVHAQAAQVQHIESAAAELDRGSLAQAALVQETADTAKDLQQRASLLRQELQGVSQRARMDNGATINHDRAGPPSTVPAAPLGSRASDNANASADEPADFDFDKAIEAHRAWKTRLRDALQQGNPLDVATICKDDQCPLGKWLHGSGRRRWGQRPAFRHLLDQHAHFHRVTSEVAQAINARQQERAEQLMGSGSAFAAASLSTIAAIREARRELAGERSFATT